MCSYLLAVLLPNRGKFVVKVTSFSRSGRIKSNRGSDDICHSSFGVKAANRQYMEDQLMRIEEKMDVILREVTGLKKRLDNLNHQPRDKPLAIQQAAEYLQLSASRLYGLIYSGKLTPMQRNKKGRVLFSLEELNKYLNK